jgi:hypothetical protein
MATDPLAQAVMVAYCGWDPTVAVTNQTVLLDGNGTFWAFLPSLNVTAVSSVVVTNPDGSTYTAALDYSAGIADVGWSANGTLVWQSPSNGGCWPNLPQTIAVTYSGGYATVPADLQAALDKLSSRMPSMSGATSKRLGSAAFSYAASVAGGGLLTVEQMVFDRYRLPRAA